MLDLLPGVEILAREWANDRRSIDHAMATSYFAQCGMAGQLYRASFADLSTGTRFADA